jgi:hypothetical protein
MSALFQLTNLVVLPFWLLAIAAPGWSWTLRIFRSPWIALPPALIYAGLIVPRLPEVLALLLGPLELPQIAAGLGTEEGATAVWAHLVTFDLFVGRWIYLDARERRIGAWLSSPLLAMVLLVGPLGWLAYLGLRALRARSPASA